MLRQIVAKDLISKVAQNYRERLARVISDRESEMEFDDIAHYLVYRVLGISQEEGERIDRYQNKGRFVYRYAGTFLEDAAKICLRLADPEAEAAKVPNTFGQRPKTFEIDCLTGIRAYEIKWRDATTDGDHITKEHTRIRAISGKGYIPIRVMFYYPNRSQAQRIQATLATLYDGVGGEYYCGDAAWEHIKSVTGVDLLQVLEEIADDVSPG